MRTIKTTDVGYDTRILRNDELDGVSGGKIDLGIFGRIHFVGNSGAFWCIGTPEVRGGDGVSCGPVVWSDGTTMP